MQDEVRAFLLRWAQLTEVRDAEHASDLYQRQPAPLVTFSDGTRVHDWLDVRVRLGRDMERVLPERIDVHHVEVREVGEDAYAVSFVYEIRVRDLWGMPAQATRLASMVLVQTKDGLRIAQAHFSAPK